MAFWLVLGQVGWSLETCRLDLGDELAFATDLVELIAVLIYSYLISETDIALCSIVKFQVRSYSLLQLAKMSSRANNLLKVFSPVSYKDRRTALDNFLQIECKSGKIEVSQAKFFFDQMLSMSPPPPILLFSTLLSGLVRCEHSSLAISFYKMLDVSGVLGPRSDPVILNILINCYSRMKLETAGFSVLGLMLKNGYLHDVISFSPLIKALFSDKKVVDAIGLYSKMCRMGCTPSIVTYNVIIDGLCKNGKARIALQLHREMVQGKDVGFVKQLMPDAKLIGARICPDVIS